MNSLIDQWNLDPLQVIVSLIIALCVAAIIVSVLINFVTASHQPRKKKEKKSIVETGTMTGFFIFFYFLLLSKAWIIEFPTTTHTILIILGTILVILGTLVNILGRVHLGKNWANQVTLYNDQTLVTSGVFRLTRHPLYASLIWMFFGASLVYGNLAAFLANLLVFVPFMMYRARQEERFLIKKFSEYKTYQQEVGMFSPKLLR